MRPCPQCKDLIDPYGRHSTICASSSDRDNRHNAQRDAWAATADAAVGGLHVQVEERRLLHGTQAAAGRRPGDVTIEKWHRYEKKGDFDFTVVAPFAGDCLHRAAQHAGHAAAAAEQLKFMESLDYCRQKGLWFGPMAVETFGGWGK